MSRRCDHGVGVDADDESGCATCDEIRMAEEADYQEQLEAEARAATAELVRIMNDTPIQRFWKGLRRVILRIVWLTR